MFQLISLIWLLDELIYKNCFCNKLKLTTTSKTLAEKLLKWRREDVRRFWLSTQLPAKGRWEFSQRNCRSNFCLLSNFYLSNKRNEPKPIAVRRPSWGERVRTSSRIWKSWWTNSLTDSIHVLCPKQKRKKNVFWNSIFTTSKQTSFHTCMWTDCLILSIC